jgi:hypothetical protein
VVGGRYTSITDFCFSRFYFLQGAFSCLLQGAISLGGSGFSNFLFNSFLGVGIETTSLGLLRMNSEGKKLS